MMMNMQDPSTYQQQQQQQQQIKPPQFPEQQEHLKCPRCDSNNTKFCYYNNYNLSQPRHFCKNCRRYWTKGGALRNIPVGGGTRKNSTKKSSNPKRHSSNSASSSVTDSTTTNSSPTPLLNLNALNSGLKPEPGSIYGAPVDQECRMLDISGSFSSLLASSGQFGNFLAGLNPNGSVGRTEQLGEFTQGLNSDMGLGLDMGRNPDLELQSGNHSESFLGIQSGDSSCWNANGGGGGGGGINGWPDLAI